jgi:predicted RND superfamily exporter protein
MKSRLSAIYKKIILDYPWASLTFLALLIAGIGFSAGNFRLDASAESLVLENDPSLDYYRNVSKQYGGDDFLLITFKPNQGMMSETTLSAIKELRNDLAKIPRVSKVNTILDVPLLNSPKVSISKLASDIRTLESPGIDKELVRKEFSESPVYKNLLMSKDGKTTVLQIVFKRDQKYYDLLYKRNDLREKSKANNITEKEQKEYKKIIKEFSFYHNFVNERQEKEIDIIREIMSDYRDKAEMFLGGVGMITSDMIRFIRHDLSVFGVGVLIFLIVALAFFFKKLRWIALPMACCFISAFVMLGYLGLFDWKVTVISSNFVSILLIITMALTIHLIVRYRDLHAERPEADHRTLVFESATDMALPCFYTALTTAVAFSSLVVSGIRPVIDFGWMMTIGVAFAFTLNFIFFPTALGLLPPDKPSSDVDPTKKMTEAIGAFSQKRRKLIFIGSGVLGILSIIGIAKLEVENRFIDYFKSTTEIYQGMLTIDKELGGTTPLDIIIDADQEFYDYVDSLKNQAESPMDDPFGDPFGEEPNKSDQTQDENFWFHPEPLLKVEAIHDYLEKIPQVGKVQSIATSMKVFRQLNDEKMPDDYDLALIRKLIPADVKGALVSPYLSEDANQIRITMRLIDSDPSLKRKELLEKITRYLVDDQKFSENDVHLTGMVELYNNMLQSLFKSQILTLGAVFFSILAMFVILFRNVLLSCLAIVPNILAAGFVLGIMGWSGIPLDMMTITIAAITVGIAVDDSIHYIHRFQEEFPKDCDYSATANRCHSSIGKAIYYTSITVTVGFSILTFSDFIPTIYFGLLTGVAMVVALINNLTLLPILIIAFKPLGPGQGFKETMRKEALA